MVLTEPVDRRSELEFFRRGAGVAGNAGHYRL